MEAELIERLSRVLSRLADERDHAFLLTDLTEWSSDELGRFFTPARRLDRLPCEEVCEGRCRGAEVRGNRAFCPTTRDYIVIRDWSPYMYHQFKWERFFEELQVVLGLPSRVASPIEGFFDLGARVMDKRSWKVLYSTSRRLSLSPLRIFGLRQRFDDEGILILTDDVPEGLLEIELAALNVFVRPWNEVVQSKLEKVTRDLASQNSHAFDLWGSLKEYTAQLGLNRYSLSALMMYSSSQQDRAFEDSTFECLRRWFDMPVKLGADLTGVSLPDGFLGTRAPDDSRKLLSLLYDDKSFSGPVFKPKADDAQGQLYYAELFAGLSSDRFLPLGTLIVSNEFPEKVQSSIASSAPWRKLMERHPLYLVGAATLEHGLRITTLLAPWFDTQFDRSAFVDGLFRLQYPSTPKWATEYLDTYRDKIDKGRYAQKFIALDVLHLEFNLVWAFLLGRRKLNEFHIGDVDQILEGAPSTNRSVLSRRWTGLEMTMISLITKGQFEEITRETGLHIPTLLLLSQFQGLRAEEVAWEFLSQRNKYQQWLRNQLKA